LLAAGRRGPLKNVRRKQPESRPETGFFSRFFRDFRGFGFPRLSRFRDEQAGAGEAEVSDGALDVESACSGRALQAESLAARYNPKRFLMVSIIFSGGGETSTVSPR
jgi:hypothetical protein